MTPRLSRLGRAGLALHATGRALCRDRRGAAAVEFVILAPIFLLIMAGLVDFGGVLYTKFGLGASVSAATNYAAVNVSGVNSTSGAALATSLATVAANAQGTAWANATVTVNAGPSATSTGGAITTSGTATAADACYCPTGTANALTWGSAQTCSAACPASGYAGKFVVVQASKTYSPFFSSYGLVHAGVLSTTSIVQVQ
jgi:Flp pilus assembly protein TadG